MSIITIGTSNPVELDTAELPAASLEALIRRGASHVFGNEVASKIVNWRKSQEKEFAAKSRKAAGDEVLSDEQAMQGYDGPSEADEDAKREEFKQEMLRHLREGTLGVRTYTSVAVDPLDAEMTKIAKEQIKVILAGQAGPDGKKLKLPKAGESVTFANGATRTLEEMIAKRFELKGEEIKKLAQQALKDKAKRQKAVQASAAEGEDLGV